MGTPGGTGNGGAQAGTPWDLIVKALGAIAAGIGALGFVTLAGGVILFERLAGAGIPAEQAIAEVPRTELLTVGASQLVPLACVVGLIVVLLWAFVEGAASQPAGATADARDATSEPRLTRLEKRVAPLRAWLANTRHRVWLLAAAAAVGGLVYFAQTADHWPTVWHSLLLLATLLAGVVLGLGVWRRLTTLVEEQTMTGAARLGWFALLIGVLIPVEGAMIGWVQSRESPLVSPAVVVESTEIPTVVSGFFIASNTDDVYLAEVDPQPHDPDLGVKYSGRILDIPRSAVVRLAFGSPQPLSDARRHWGSLVTEVEATFPPKTTFRVAP